MSAPERLVSRSPEPVPESGPWSPSFLQAATLLLTWTAQRQLAQEQTDSPAT